VFAVDSYYWFFCASCVFCIVFCRQMRLLCDLVILITRPQWCTLCWQVELVLQLLIIIGSRPCYHRPQMQRITTLWLIPTYTTFITMKIQLLGVESATSWLQVPHPSQPCAGSGVVRIDPLCFLAGCLTRRLNQV